MKVFRFEDMTNGWFIGDFKPTSFSTKDCEVALKRYRAGDYEEKHIHKIATEITFIVKGKALMNNIEYSGGDIIVLEPHDATDFKALTDVENIIIKVPSVKGDKYLLKEDKQKTVVLTHRGLEPTNTNFFPESSYESFENHLSRGFGIEFDPCFVKNCIVVSHDSSLKRMTSGEDERDFETVSWRELKEIKYGKEKKGRIPLLDEVFDLINKNISPINAMHLKGKYQSKEYLDKLIDLLKKYPVILNKILIFDLKPETARYIKQHIPQISLAPSISHSYDIQRYGSLVGNTLFSIEDAIKYSKEKLFDWVWLDEWDLNDENNQTKKFYNKDNFDILRKYGYKIALITPELHGTSPELYGGESHQDSRDKETLLKRIKEIINLNPDAVCTDYPRELAKLLIKL